MTESDSGKHFATRSRAEKKSLTFFREAGRGKALVHINNLVKFNPGLILLMGEEGSGRSRVLKQFADSLKGKPGRICILDQVIKNDNQLYAAIAEGFGVDHIPGDDIKSLQKSVQAFLEANVTTHKPVIIALDDVQRCSLAMLEALIGLQVKFKQMSLIVIGDNGLQKMLQRLQGGKITPNPVLLSALDAREIRQYMNWRLPFQITDIELNNIVTLSRGNLASLEKEALKQEATYEQKNAQQSDGGMKSSSQSTVRWLLVILVAGAVGTAYFLYPGQFSQKRFTDIYSSGLFSPVQKWLHPDNDHTDNNQVTVIDNTQPPVLPVRSSEEWVERQVVLITETSP